MVSFYSLLSLSMNSWPFVSHLTLQYPFCLNGSTFSFSRWYTAFQLISQSLVSTSRAQTILVSGYQLHCHLPGLFGAVLSFQRPSNLVRIFLYHRYDLAAQLGMILHCIFTIFRLISNFSILFAFSDYGESGLAG